MKPTWRKASKAHGKMFYAAIKLTLNKRVISTSMIQREYHIGYNKAVRLHNALRLCRIIDQKEGGQCTLTQFAEKLVLRPNLRKKYGI